MGMTIWSIELNVNHSRTILLFVLAETERHATLWYFFVSFALIGDLRIHYNPRFYLCRHYLEPLKGEYEKVERSRAINLRMMQGVTASMIAYERSVIRKIAQLLCYWLNHAVRRTFFRWLAMPGYDFHVIAISIRLLLSA